MGSKTEEIGCQGSTKYYTKPSTHTHTHTSKPCSSEAKFLLRKH
ncbi:uncharacterized protein PgNI_00605 [Pyricularia grisea]|uniref:Uncharacterized protein n=1 Tax=Pyricularia grisea TaxID=148305 RepID=A0A6P8BHU8_PYRGI|nr:uncharacterized protein PgNI_00605 [Pyricularia grisea]TLD16300.1 hypothetical protein PgNI_00605 [Pyricularia grisea]